MARGNQRWRRDERHEDAGKRQEARNSRTAKQQMNLLDSRLGKNVGAKKERAELQKQIAVPAKNEEVTAEAE